MKYNEDKRRAEFEAQQREKFLKDEKEREIQKIRDLQEKG